MNIPSNISEAAERFGGVAARFCSIVDSAATLDRTELLIQVYRILPELIGEAIALPDFSLTGDENDEDEMKESQARNMVRAKAAQWEHLYSLLKERLGDWDVYWQVFDPTKDNEAIYGSLADDIADIYRDVKEGLTLRGQLPPEDLIWDWRVGYYSHWGKHAIDALLTIHFRVEEALSL